MKKTNLALLVVTAVFLALTAARAQDTANINLILRLEGPDQILEVVAYEVGNVKFRVLGLIFGRDEISDPLTPERRVSFAADGALWGELIRLCGVAADNHPSTWTDVGTLAETFKGGRCKVVVASGPSLRFTIIDPKKGTHSYVVAESDVKPLLEALQKVDAYLNR